MLQPTRSLGRTPSTRPTTSRSRRCLDRDALDASVSRASSALLGAQDASGCWKSEPDMGPIALAITALLESWLGVLHDDDARRYAVSLVRAQRDDGGFEIHPHAGASTLGATATCRAALAVCGIASTHRAVKKAEARLASLGGYEAVRARLVSHGEPGAIFCAMAGLLPGAALPALSPDMAALPWSERMLDGRVHGGVPVVFYACAAVRERLAPTTVLPSLLRGPTRTIARTRLSSYVGQFQCPNGSWNGMVFSTVFNLLALSGVGIDASDPMMKRALAWIETRKQRRGKGVFVSVFDGEIWETAFALQALTVSGVAPDDASVERGVRYLERHQSSAPQLRVNQPRAGAPRTGGWAYHADNPAMPDCDDTGVVLAALGRARSAQRPGDGIARGVAWLEGMQNACGGWGSYVHGLPDKPAGQPIFDGRRAPLNSLEGLSSALAHPPPELGDPAVADVCGRVLWGFGECGLTIDSALVARAVAFLERDQCASGAWFGLWNPAYVSGTAFALLGLASVGVGAERDSVQRGLAWLLSVQNDDGGFGEEAASFGDPSRAGRAPSMPPLTGIVLRALSEHLARGPRDSAIEAAAERAASYLVKTQEETGGWPNEGYLFTIVPPTFYTWGHHRLYYPLFGLGRYREVTARRSATRARSERPASTARKTRRAGGAR